GASGPVVGDPTPDRAEEHIREQPDDAGRRDPRGRAGAFEDEHDQGDVVEPVADLRQTEPGDQEANVTDAEGIPEARVTIHPCAPPTGRTSERAPARSLRWGRRRVRSGRGG